MRPPLPRAIARAFPRPSVRALAACAALPLLAASVAAQTTATSAGALAPAATGAVEGVALGPDGAPIPFALVRVLPAAGAAGARPVAQVATGAHGRFRLDGLPPGSWRLQLARIGYRPVLSEPVAVRGGETVRQTVRGDAQPVQLATVVARGAPACLTGDRIAEEPALAAVWTQALDGIALRRAFQRQYRYREIETVGGTVHWRLRGARPIVRRPDTTLVTPDSAEARDRRWLAERRAKGYRNGNDVVAPDERELAHPEFLRDHCLEAAPLHAEGLVGVRFRPTDARRDAEEVQGVLWLDAHDYRARVLDVEWVKGGRRSAVARLDYGDVTVDGAAVRLITGGTVTLERMYGPGAATFVSGVRALYRVRYEAFAPAVASR